MKVVHMAQSQEGERAPKQAANRVTLELKFSGGALKKCPLATFLV